MELTLQYEKLSIKFILANATILVFMELTLQSKILLMVVLYVSRHNPCFYGINFAISS